VQLCTWKASALQIQPHIAHLYSNTSAILKKTRALSLSDPATSSSDLASDQLCSPCAQDARGMHEKHAERSERMPNAPYMTLICKIISSTSRYMA